MYNDSILTMQGHPDFNDNMITDIILPSLIQRGKLEEEDREVVHESLQLDNHGLKVMKMLCEFVKL